MRHFTSIALLVGLSASGCVVTTDEDSSLLVDNQSDFEIHEMYVTDVDSPTWGPNLLTGTVLFPGDSMLLAIDCGIYDAMLIDETDAICEVHNIDLCFDDADWIIRNNTCAVFEARAAAAAAAKALTTGESASTK
jgi:hypothetical protein